MLRLLADENFNRGIVRGVLLREPLLDLIRAQDVGLSGRSDPDILEWAAENNRILLTYDRTTMPKHVQDRHVAGGAVAGVFVLNDRMPIREAIEQILLLITCSDQAEWNGLVVFLPL